MEESADRDPELHFLDSMSEANKPNPQELDDGEILTIDNVERYKRPDCKLYTDCLDFAANAGWQQFHCNSCKCYVPIPADDPSQELFDSVGERLLDLFSGAEDDEIDSEEAE